jgi:ribosomal protein S18 acetylase RimI-like enzyme
MKKSDRVRVELVGSWHEESIVNLYKEGGWWKEYMDPSNIPQLISGSYLFAVAVDISTGRSIGMGRAISDGIADAYIQDVVVLSRWRRKGVGSMIVSTLLEGCISRKISWIGLIAMPGTEALYESLGFRRMNKHVPMLFGSHPEENRKC